jgi:hypothetical protein
MTRWGDSWDWTFDREFEGEHFASVEVQAKSLEKHGYWSSSWEAGTAHLWVHEASGIVTADPRGFALWVQELKGVRDVGS